ncbi:MAG: hypothetical protein ABI647_00520 [Gemmatimonadota bacterium]
MLAFATLAVLSLVAAPRTDIKSGEDVIRAMHDKYANTWYKKLSFVQRAIWFDGRPEGEWWEAMFSPGRLRIDIAPIDSGRGVVYKSDSVFRFANKKVAGGGPGQNALLILGFDVYNQAPERSIEILKKEGFDLSKVREDTWQGKAVYVVGAAKGDEKTNQFWIEKDRLLFAKVIEPGQNGSISDIRFEKYVKLGGGWLATECLFYTDGKLSFHEIYRDWKINDAVNDDLFNTKEWKWPGWVPKH